MLCWDGESVVRDQGCDVGELGLFGLEEFAAGGRVEEEIAKGDGGADGKSGVFDARMLPPAISTRVPEGSSATRVSSCRRETLAMEGRASPRKPRVAMASRSSEVRSFEVAWRSKARSASSRTMP